MQKTIYSVRYYPLRELLAVSPMNYLHTSSFRLPTSLQILLHGGQQATRVPQALCFGDEGILGTGNRGSVRKGIFKCGSNLCSNAPSLETTPTDPTIVFVCKHRRA